MKPIDILLADDHNVVRMGLSALFGYQADFRVLGEARDGAEAVALAKKLHPDVVVMDLMMPKLNGVEATRLLKSTETSVNVLILTSYGSSAEVADALAAGAVGVMLKDATNEELLSAVRQVAQGIRVVSAEIENTLRHREPPAPALTEKQAQILHSVTRGLTNPEIARQFGISIDGVKHHLNAIFAKLGASTRTEAAAIALRDRLLKI